MVKGSKGQKSFCPSCGTRRQPEWRFCAACGAGFEASRRPQAADRRGSPIAGVAVFCVLAIVGVGMWWEILQPKLREGPPGLPGAAAQVASAGGSALPEGHPPVEGIELPDDIKAFIADLAAKAEQQPTDVTVWQQLAGVQYRAARIDSTYYQAALKSYQHLLELEPERPDAIRGLANVYFDLGQYASAKPHLETYVATHPNDPAARTDLATARLHLGDVDGAIADYREIAGANPEFVQAHYNLGVALQRTGDMDGALAAFRRARDSATDDRIRGRVDLVISQLEGDPNGTPGAQPSHDAAEAAAGSSAPTPFQQSVERYFRSHDIIGRKIAGIAWTAPMTATVTVRDFPMAQMPPFARAKFTDRILEALREAKATSGERGVAEVAIVDARTKAVMETVKE